MARAMRDGLACVFLMLQTGCAVAIIIITALRLSDVTWFSDGDIVHDDKCLLGTNDSGNSGCRYAYIVAGVSLLASVAVSIFRCFTCNLCGCGVILDLLLSGVGTAWWIVASVIMTNIVDNANDRNIPREDWRKTVLYLCYAGAACFGIVFIVSCISLLARLCHCCGSGKHHHEGRVKYVDNQPAPQRTGFFGRPRHHHAAQPAPGAAPSPQFITGQTYV